MKRLRSIVAAMALAFSAGAAEARPPEVERALSGAQLVGQARYQVVAWTLFDAALWTEDGAFSWERPFALTLTYRHSFSSDALSDRTIVEMARRGAAHAPDRLGALLRTCFPDVSPGDRITGVSTGPDSAIFHHNGRQLCQIEWPGFRRGFFGIWLDASGQGRSFSAQLLGNTGNRS